MKLGVQAEYTRVPTVYKKTAHALHSGQKFQQLENRSAQNLIVYSTYTSALTSVVLFVTCDEDDATVMPGVSCSVNVLRALSTSTLVLEVIECIFIYINV